MEKHYSLLQYGIDYDLTNFIMQVLSNCLSQVKSGTLLTTLDTFFATYVWAR